VAKFSKSNFRLIINEIEDMEAADQNIWVPIGILEVMYDDYSGLIDNYFHGEKSKRSFDLLWLNLTSNQHINWDDWINRQNMEVKTVPLPFIQKWEPCEGPNDYPFSPTVTCTSDDYKIDS
jgi:hypothetical protein